MVSVIQIFNQSRPLAVKHNIAVDVWVQISLIFLAPVNLVPLLLQTVQAVELVHLLVLTALLVSLVTTKFGCGGMMMMTNGEIIAMVWVIHENVLHVQLDAHAVVLISVIAALTTLLRMVVHVLVTPPMVSTMIL